MRDRSSRLAAALLVLGAAAFGFAPAPRASAPGVHAVAPPPGHTGGFGEPTCLVCHLGAPLNVSGGRVSLSGLPVEGYRRGEAYVLTVVLESEEMGAAGFQLSVRHPDGTPAGRLRPVDARVAVTAGPHGVTYAHQTTEGSRTSGPDLASWSLAWTAPEGGPVVIHLAANSANGDNSPLSDLVYATSADLADVSGR